MTTEAIRLTPRRLLATAAYLLAYPVLMMAIAGDWAWVQGWIFNLWYVTLCAATMVYLYLKDPALLAERYRRPGTGGEANWDRVFVYALGTLYLVWIVVMPLDARRFHWSAGFPLGVTLVGALLLIVAAFFLFRAFSDNTYLSPLVRIQSERQHRVVSSGVYGVIRHPMYLGADCLFLGAPLFLGSILGLVIGLVMMGVLAARIVGEERLLVRQLEGYDAYRQQVRYRLIPRVW